MTPATLVVNGFTPIDAGGGPVLTPVELAEARRALDRTLSARRHAIGVKQVRLTRLVPWSQSTIANVEMGRQNVPRAFWQDGGRVLSAHGELLSVSDYVDWLTRRYREQVSAKQTGPPLAPRPAQRCPCGGAWVLVPVRAGWPG
ncbi:helix-turn-helix domain-containing protein [Micromonospora thermarum]|uniref:Helix-turn-helix domain-containing protein n=1 Tax=Micromonospora thermarum TaxID=2720024 RepID=A0ABX0ZFX1_9ACTN|nr:helix-turn-helix domain-containing protein [Micromonospora thermarum]NJP34800.1 helix-turn-helix domain-containing protein [Micromonospora thermarum]